MEWRDIQLIAAFMYFLLDGHCRWWGFEAKVGVEAARVPWYWMFITCLCV